MLHWRFASAAEQPSAVVLRVLPPALLSSSVQHVNWLRSPGHHVGVRYVELIILHVQAAGVAFHNSVSLL